MVSIDALARAIKEYEGGVVIVSHDFRKSYISSTCHVPPTHVRTGLISQVAKEIWEVKGRKIRNLTKEDISIVDYKKMLVRNSASPYPISVCGFVLTILL
jgi:ATP-binding cassette subfamily F protein 2